MLDQKLDQMDEKDRDRSLLLVNSLPSDFGSFPTRIIWLIMKIRFSVYRPVSKYVYIYHWEQRMKSSNV